MLHNLWTKSGNSISSIIALAGERTNILRKMRRAKYIDQLSFHNHQLQGWTMTSGVNFTEHALHLRPLFSGVFVGATVSNHDHIELHPHQIDLFGEGSGSYEMNQYEVPSDNASRLDLYMAILGLAGFKDKVECHTAFFNGEPSDHNGIQYEIGRPFDYAETNRFAYWMYRSVLSMGLPPADAEIVPIGLGIRILNRHPETLSNERFLKLIKKVIQKAQVGKSNEQGLHTFRAVIRSIEARWDGDVGGREYINQILSENRWDLIDSMNAHLLPRLESVYRMWSQRRFGSAPKHMRIGANYEI